MSDKDLWITSPESDWNSANLEKVRGYLIPEYIRANIDTWGWGNAIAFECAETGRKYTHRQVLNNSRLFAAGLMKLGPELGLQRNDVVAVILPNVPEYASILFGIWEAGLEATNVNPKYTKNEIDNQLKVCHAKLIITSFQLLAVAKAIQSENSGIKKIVILDSDSDSTVNATYENCTLFSQLIQTETMGVNFFTGSQTTPDNDVALIAFSSGTSGTPKGVMLTHFAILSNAILCNFVQSRNAKKYSGTGDYSERTISVLPFFHAFGLTTILLTMIQGAHSITMPAFIPTVFVRILRQFKPTLLYIVPTLVSFIVNNDSIGPQELDQLWGVTCGSAFAGEELIKRFLDKAKQTVFLEGYGLTELTTVSMYSRFQKIGSIGQPLPEVFAKVINATTGATLGKEERGEVCIKSPCVMKGYLNNAVATSECIDDDGWFHTGDIGYYDEDGCFFIVDRLKELIKVKGFQVSPSELEDVIRGHEKVAEVGVIGIPDEISGEAPRAYVVPKTGEKLTANEILNFVTGKVSPYKYLKGGVKIVEDIPKGNTGKILRKVLKQKYIEERI